MTPATAISADKPCSIAPTVAEGGDGGVQLPVAGGRHYGATRLVIKTYAHCRGRQ